VPADEKQPPVVRADETEFLQDMVRIGPEVPGSKEPKLDQIPYRLTLVSTVTSRVFTRLGRKNYVSHVDIFLFECYSKRHTNEMIVRGWSVAI